MTIILAFLMAMAANKKRKVSWFYELTFAFPMAVSMSVAALIFKLMLNPQIGIVNHIFGWMYSGSTVKRPHCFL